jgi:hypothetical protein
MKRHPFTSIKLMYWRNLAIMVLLLAGLPALAQGVQTEPGQVFASALQQQGPTDPQELEAFLDEFFVSQMQAYNIPGAAIAVVEEGELFFAKGYADLEKRTPINSGSLSGEIFCPDYQAGKIYVLALKAENKGKIREVETEAYPYNSQYVYQYTFLDAPGTYRISELEEGEYVLWAWVDVNGDGGVNHLNYAEPSGWYQTDEHLFLANVSVGMDQEAIDIDIQLISPTPYPEENRNVTRGQGGGTLKTVKNYKVLHLFGTPEERGYAYGYLVGPQIVDWVEYVLVENFAGSVSFYEESFLPYMKEHFSGNEKYAPEINAMLEGMKDSGTDMYIDLLGREITREDIEAENAYCFLLYYKMYGAFRTPCGVSPFSCTSAVVWGDWTQNGELNGGLIHGKNMDGEVDLRKVTVNSLLIIATEPPIESGLKKVVGIDWPGFFGTFNGMNEDGLILVPHSSPSIPDWDATNMLAYPLFYRETLQRCSTIADGNNFWESSTTCRTGGLNTAISVPYQPSQEGFPSVTYETDSYGGAIREPDDIPPSDAFSILTTNNFFNYTGVNPEAVSKVDGYHSEIMPENYRYRAMMERVDQFRDDGRTVGTTEMIELLRAASTSEEYSGITEYSFIGYPNKMSFALAREDLAFKILDASYAEFTEFTFDEVFQAQPLSVSKTPSPNPTPTPESPGYEAIVAVGCLLPMAYTMLRRRQRTRKRKNKGKREEIGS